MKTSSFLKAKFLLILLLSFTSIAKADVTSVSGSNLDYYTSSTWVGGKTPANNQNDKVVIANGSKVIADYVSVGNGLTIDGELVVNDTLSSNNNVGIYVSSTGRLVVNELSSESNFIIEEGGVVIVNGSLTQKNRKLELYGELNVAGKYTLSNDMDVNPTGVLNIGGDFTHDSGSTLLVDGKINLKGDFTTNLGLKINSTGYFAIDGSFKQTGNNTFIDGGTIEIKKNLTTGVGFKVYNEGNVIVYGDLFQTGSNIEIEKSLVIVAGNYTGIDGSIKSDGTLIIGGNLNQTSGTINVESSTNGKIYITNPDATVTRPNDNNYKYGDLDDLLNEKGDNENIMDWLEKTELSGSNIAWTGAKDSIWFNKDNWSPKIAPKPTSNVTIKSVETVSPSLNSDEGKIEIKNLTIEAGASLTLEPGNSLVISKNFNNSGDFVIQNSYGDNKISSFYASGNTNGIVKIELTLPTNSWYYLSSPIDGPKPEHFSSVKESFSGTPYYYNYVNNAWAISPTKIEETEGISAYYLTSNAEEKEVTLKYEGKLNTGDVTKTMTKKGFYLFGNPFAVPINWQDEKMDREKVAGTIWYRTRVEGEKGSEMGFVTYNRYAPDEGKVAVYPNEYDEYESREKEFAIIQPYQSVWVYTRTATSDNPAKITISNAQKVPNNQGGTLKSSSAGKKADIIRVVSKNSISRDGAVIYFSEDATDGSDDAGDSPKYFNSSVDIPEVYTKVGSNSLAINGLAPFEGEYQLPLSVRNRTTDEVTLSFNLSNYRKDDVIVLHDRYLDEKINLRSTNKYSYTPLSLGDDHNRFVMMFNPEGYEEENVSTDISDILADANDSQNISIVEKSGNAIVTVNQHLLDKGAGKIEVYSIDGVKLSESVIYSSKTLIVLPKDKGVYVVAATASGERKVVKLLIK